MLETKYKIGKGEYIPFPAEAMTDFKSASKSALLVLLTLSRELCADPDAVIDIDGLVQSTGCDRDDVEDALIYWRAKGILQESDDYRSVIASNLEIVLKREPANYEVKALMNTIGGTGLDIETAVRIIKLSSYRTDTQSKVSWIDSAIREIAKLPSPEPRISELERYYSLTRMIREGFPITRKFTQKEKQIICSWATKKIPLNTIFNAYSVSVPIARTVSFQHMDKLLEKAVIPVVDVSELGY